MLDLKSVYVLTNNLFKEYDKAIEEGNLSKAASIQKEVDKMFNINANVNKINLQ